MAPFPILALEHIVGDHTAPAGILDAFLADRDHRHSIVRPGTLLEHVVADHRRTASGNIDREARGSVETIKDTISNNLSD